MIRNSLSQAVGKATVVATPLKRQQSSLIFLQRSLNNNINNNKNNPLIRRRGFLELVLKPFSTSAASTQASHLDGEARDAGRRNNNKILSLAVAAAAGAAAAIAMFGQNNANTTTINTVACEQQQAEGDDEDETADDGPRVPQTTLDYLNFEVWTPAAVDKVPLMELVNDHDDEMEGYPVYTSKEVAANDGTDGKPIWMSYGGVSWWQIWHYCD